MNKGVFTTNVKYLKRKGVSLVIMVIYMKVLTSEVDRSRDKSCSANFASSVFFLLEAQTRLKKFPPVTAAERPLNEEEDGSGHVQF